LGYEELLFKIRKKKTNLGLRRRKRVGRLMLAYRLNKVEALVHMKKTSMPIMAT
jgi:hypothetical protein